MRLLYVFFLSAALGVDALFSGVGYGIKGIRVPLGSLAVIGLVTGTCTVLVMVMSYWLGEFADVHTATTAGAVVLIALGVYRLMLEYLSKGLLPPETGRPVMGRMVRFSIGALVISIMTKPEVADLDQSKHISAGEAILLGGALAVDNMVAASAGSLGGLLPAYTPLVMAFVQVALISVGLYGCARLCNRRRRFRLPYVAGIVLVVLGLLRFF